MWATWKSEAGGGQKQFEDVTMQVFKEKERIRSLFESEANMELQIKQHQIHTKDVEAEVLAQQRAHRNTQKETTTLNSAIEQASKEVGILKSAIAHTNRFEKDVEGKREDLTDKIATLEEELTSLSTAQFKQEFLSETDAAEAIQQLEKLAENANDLEEADETHAAKHTKLQQTKTQQQKMATKLK
eukprot:Platyproteum_vivax@DN15253_c0_g1_i1.p1